MYIIVTNTQNLQQEKIKAELLKVQQPNRLKTSNQKEINELKNTIEHEKSLLKSIL